MVTQVRPLLSLCVGLSAIAISQPARAETNSNEAKAEQAHRQLLEDIKLMKHHDEHQDAELKRMKEQINALIDEKLQKNPDFAVNAASLADDIKDSKLPHQEQVFMQALADLACRTLHDDCELKTRLNEYEARLRELEREKSQPGEPPPLLPPPNTHSPPTWQVPMWPYSVDRIVLPQELSRNAALVAQCVDKFFGDVTYHGNVYLDQGRYVFVRHNKTAPQPMILAKPVTP
jgi:hypothetical protein